MNVVRIVEVSFFSLDSVAQALTKYSGKNNDSGLSRKTWHNLSTCFCSLVAALASQKKGLKI